MAKTFLLGLGAQKAGTTWLHRYLCESPIFARGAMKEFHVWNEREADRPTAIAIEGDASGGKAALRSRMLASPDSYFDYFEELLAAPGKEIAADITPAYASLTAASLVAIKQGFERRGIRVKAIFLMRDPVERCWSAVRMYRRKRLALPEVDLAGNEEEALLRYCASTHARQRGRYDLTVQHLDDVIPSRDIHYGTFEELFEERSIVELSAFLGVAPRPDLASSRFNESPKAAQLSPGARRAAAAEWKDALRFCARRFPETRRLWPSYELVQL